MSALGVFCTLLACTLVVAAVVLAAGGGWRDGD